MASRIIGPSSTQMSTSKAPEPNLHNKGEVRLQIKLRLLVSWAWDGGSILGCPGGSNVIIKVLCKWKREVESGARVREMYEVTTLLALRMEEGWERRNVGSLHKLEEANTNKQTNNETTKPKTDSALQPLERKEPYQFWPNKTHFKYLTSRTIR